MAGGIEVSMDRDISAGHTLRFTGEMVVARMDRLAKSIEGLTKEVKRLNDRDDLDSEIRQKLKDVTKVLQG